MHTEVGCIQPHVKIKVSGYTLLGVHPLQPLEKDLHSPKGGGGIQQAVENNCTCLWKLASLEKE